MIQQILTDENPLLREMSREVTPEELATPEMQQVIDDMLHTLKATTGVGLAAPQIGKLLRIVIVDKPMTVLVNPVVSFDVGDAKEMCFEGCLSIPGKRGEVERYRTVRVNALTREGKPFEAVWTKFRANVIQHEEDHLNGILYWDRARAMFGDETAHAPAARAGAGGFWEKPGIGGRKTLVVQSPQPVKGKQFIQWQFPNVGRMVEARITPGAAIVTGVWLSGVKLRSAGYKVGAINKMLLGEHGLHVAAGDILRIELQMPSSKKLCAEADFDG